MIKCKSLSVGYGKNLIVKNLDLEITKGETTSIIGPNGSGKSTILRAITGNLKPRSGEVYIKDKLVKSYKSRELAKIITFMPQVLKVIPGFTVNDIVGFGRFPHLGFRGKLTQYDRDIVNWAIAAVGLERYRHRPVNRLSGGEFQRSRIAMAIAQESEIILFDEPTTFLDISHQLHILELVEKIKEEMGKTILMVLHDINQAARYSDSMVVLEDGELFEQGSPTEILSQNILNNVFKIKARILDDDEHGKYFLADTVLNK